MSTTIPLAQSAQEIARQAQAEAQQQAQTAQEAARVAREQAREAMQQAREEIRRAVEEARLQAEQARAEARPGVLVQPFPPFGRQSPIPEEAVLIAIAFFIMCAVIAIGIPIARAFARRMDRKGAVDPSAGAETRGRLERIEHAVDAIAVEVERISEGQRYTTKILSAMKALPEPDPVEANAAAGLRRVREAQR